MVKLYTNGFPQMTSSTNREDTYLLDVLDATANLKPQITYIPALTPQPESNGRQLSKKPFATYKT